MKVELPGWMADALRALKPGEAFEFKGENGDRFVFMKAEEYDKLAARVAPPHAPEGAT